MSLQKISCAREIVSKLPFRSLALSLQKISCAREIVSKLPFRSLALSLQKISCARGIVGKLPFRSLALSLPPPCAPFRAAAQSLIGRVASHALSSGFGLHLLNGSPIGWQLILNIYLKRLVWVAGCRPRRQCHAPVAAPPGLGRCKDTATARQIKGKTKVFSACALASVFWRGVALPLRSAAAP